MRVRRRRHSPPRGAGGRRRVCDARRRVPDPNLAALTCALVLVLVVGNSALNAALVSGVLYLALSAVRREGGARRRAPWRSASPSSRCASA